MITATEAARLLGVSSGPNARRTLDRWGIQPTGRAPGRGGESLYDETAVRRALAQRPGRGARTDLQPPAIDSRNVRDNVVLPVLGEFADEHDVDGIVSDLLDHYPITGWVCTGTEYTHPDLDEDVFWSVVQQHAK